MEGTAWRTGVSRTHPNLAEEACLPCSGERETEEDTAHEREKERNAVEPELDDILETSKKKKTIHAPRRSEGAQKQAEDERKGGNTKR